MRTRHDDPMMEKCSEEEVALKTEWVTLLKERMRVKGVTQDKLAELLGVNKSSVAQYFMFEKRASLHLSTIVRCFYVLGERVILDCQPIGDGYAGLRYLRGKEHRDATRFRTVEQGDEDDQTETRRGRSPNEFVSRPGWENADEAL